MEKKKLNTRKKSKSDKKLNKQAMVATVIFSCIFLFMIGYYMYFILVTSPSIINNSYNRRIDAYADTVIRGSIYSNSGDKLAYTDTNGTESDMSDDIREYPYGKVFAHVVGIKTHGKSGLEKLCNYDLLSTETSALQKIINDFADETERGCDVYTTLDTNVQETAYESLGDNDGAVFAINPETGAILAQVSRPSYNPGTVDEIWDELANDKNDSRLLNRSTQGKYIPGSVFKIVTTLEYMRENNKFKKFSYDCNGKADFKGFSINCFDSKSHYDENLEEAFAYSCNSAFASIGDKLNINSFSETSKDLLFDSELPLEMEYNKSIFPLDNNSTQFDITQTSIGQGKTTVTPAHMALIASAIYNKGVLMTPYIVDYVENGYGKIVRTTRPIEYKQLMSKKEAKQLKAYMKAVCDYGTGKVMANTDYNAYGKTGTAEIDKDGHVNSWFVGFASKGDKKIAIAVVIENMNEGSNSATNCAKKIFDNYFE